MVGPDAYRLVAEFVLSRIDLELNQLVGNSIVGAVRHVDDYYFGLRTEHEAESVLSHLREILANYELNLNDQKTKIYSSLEPINDLWAQRLRDHMTSLCGSDQHGKLERAISEAVATAVKVGSDSPLKILFRSFDEMRIYRSSEWEFVEKHIQRIIQKHPHAIDYACLLVAKRVALGSHIDTDGWKDVAEIIIKRGLALNHHHEVVWMVWLLIICGIEISESMAEELAKARNSHIRTLLVKAFIDDKLSRKPRLALGAPLSTVDENWLVNLVAKSEGFSRAAFSGAFTDEFDHLSKRHIKLIDFDEHINSVRNQNKRAISRIRYGYDDDEDYDENGDINYFYDPLEMDNPLANI